MQVQRLVIGMIFSGLVCGAALAQNTVAELLAAGGKQLTKEELKTTLSGANVSGPTATGGEWNVDWKADGTLSGTVINPTGRRGSVFGTWTIDDAGLLCRDATLRFYESSQLKDCSPLYKLGDQFYAPAATPAEPSTKLLLRSIKR